MFYFESRKTGNLKMSIYFMRKRVTQDKDYRIISLRKLKMSTDFMRHGVTPDKDYRIISLHIYVVTY